jgi:hypothetical protein
MPQVFLRFLRNLSWDFDRIGGLRGEKKKAVLDSSENCPGR